MTDKTYNGWPNWETWNAHLWITNEEVLYWHAREIVADTIRLWATFVPDDPQRHHAIARGGDLIRAWWEDYNAAISHPNGPMQDAWSRYCDRVDWERVAEALAESHAPNGV